MTNFFWNDGEHRLRAGWRLLLFVGVVIVCYLLAYLLLGGLVAEGVDVRFWVLGVALVAIGITVRWVDRRPWRDLGMYWDRAWGLDLAFGLALGLGLQALVFGVEYGLGWLTVTGTAKAAPGASVAGGLVLALLAYGAVGIYEELIFRGYLLRNVAEGLRFGPVMPRDAVLLALALTSVAFGFAHAGNPNATLVSTFNISLAGIFLGLGYVLTGRMAIPMGLHITWNFAQGNIFGFPVSGTGDAEARVLTIEQGGPDLWTGGDFGPEAGLLGLLAMALGVLLTLAWVRWQSGPLRVRGTLAQYVRSEPAAEDTVGPDNARSV